MHDTSLGRAPTTGAIAGAAGAVRWRRMGAVALLQDAASHRACQLRAHADVPVKSSILAQGRALSKWPFTPYLQHAAVKGSWGHIQDGGGGGVGKSLGPRVQLLVDVYAGRKRLQPQAVAAKINAVARSIGKLRVCKLIAANNLVLGV
jgi:hypothetical protein